MLFRMCTAFDRSLALELSERNGWLTFVPVFFWGGLWDSDLKGLGFICFVLLFAVGWQRGHDLGSAITMFRCWGVGSSFSGF